MKGGAEFHIGIIGGGPAGMAAAWAAAECGAKVTLIERNSYLGGVLPQCIHTGFGTQLYGEDLTGGEYAERWENLVRREDIRVILSATVTDVSGHWDISYADSRVGAAKISCDAVILATGCTERTLPQLDVPGSRPAGIFTAGAAQRMMNIRNMMPGTSALILGSGDIGLIMARRMRLEGIDVKLVLGEKETGLARNIVQCVEDFEIPLRYGWTVSRTHGYRRLEGVTIREIETGREEYVECDTLLVAAGLLPDRDLVSEELLNQEGMYVCGNADHVHDLVDNVSLQAVRTAVSACLKADPQIRIPQAVKQIMDMTIPEQSKEKRGNMVCTVCPKGCIMTVRKDPFSVSGCECARGRDFAAQEISDPRRVVTMMLRVRGGGVVSARTAGPVSGTHIEEVMTAAKEITVPPDVSRGDIVEAESITGAVAEEGGLSFVITGKPTGCKPRAVRL